MPGVSTKTKRVDMQKLADLAGVSRSTVSRALNDSPLVNERTKKSIQRLAEENQFVINESARNLRLQRSNIIGLVLMHDVEQNTHLSDPFFLRMVSCIANSLADAGQDLMLYHKPVVSASKFLTTRVYRQCDGTIFIGQGTIHDELNKLTSYQKPIAVWGANIADRKYQIVGTDNVYGGFQATTHLIQQGCKNIAFFGDTEKPELRLRYNGYNKALKNAGLTPNLEHVLAPPMQRDAADKIIDNFITNMSGIDGIVCSSDMLATTTISTLQRHGIAVPSDVAVTGYDDLEIGTRINPSLTTVSQDIPSGGELLVKMMMGLLNGKKTNDSICKSKLVVRESSLYGKK